MTGPRVAVAAPGVTPQKHCPSEVSLGSRRKLGILTRRAGISPVLEWVLVTSLMRTVSDEVGNRPLCPPEFFLPLLPFIPTHNFLCFSIGLSFQKIPSAWEVLRSKGPLSFLALSFLTQKIGQ